MGDRLVQAATQPQTPALQRVLALPMHHSAIADFLFLEAWEREPSDSAGVALRVGQIRRANPALAAEIRAQVLAEDKARRGAWPVPAR